MTMPAPTNRVSAPTIRKIPATSSKMIVAHAATSAYGAPTAV